MHSLCLASVNFTVVFWVVAALHWKTSHHLFCSYLREMIPRAGSPVVKSILPKETNSVTQMGLDLGAATPIPGWGSSEPSWKLPKLTLKQEQETSAVGEKCHFWLRGWVGQQGTKQSRSSGTPRSPGMSPPKHGHSSPQLPPGGRDGSAAGGKFQQQILSCCFLLPTGRECCSLVCFPHVQERQSEAWKSLDASHKPLVTLNPALSAQLLGFLQYLLKTCTKRSAWHSMGFFPVPVQDAQSLPWKCSSAIPEASCSQQGQKPQM